MSEEEKKAIEEIKKDEEYYDILHNIQENKYDMWNVEKLMRDSTNGNYTEYEIAQSIVYFINKIEKQQKEIEYYKAQDTNKGKLLNTALNETKNNCISKDKIRAKIKELKYSDEICPKEDVLLKADILSLIHSNIDILKELLEENKSNENNI